MNTPVKYGVILGVVVGVLGFAIPALGLHTNMLASVGFLVAVIAINIVVVILALRQTATDSGYGRQIVNGLVVGVVGAVIVFLGSWVTTVVVFPSYLDEVAQGTRTSLAALGLSAEQIEAQVGDGSAVGSAFQGAIGTVVTSVVVAAIVAIFKRAGR